MIKLRDKTLRLRNDITREDLINNMKKYGIRVKCSSVDIGFEKAGEAGPGMRIRYVTAGSGEASFIHGPKSKKLAEKLLGLKSKEDCERVNRELES